MTDITLYYSQKSFYCHRIRIGLEEKGLSYDERRINLGNLENYSPSFLQVNPDGQVPTLKHGDKIVTESEKILRYLDNAFPDTTKLFPDPSSEEGEQCEYYISLANKVDLDTLSLGVPVHADFEKCEIKSDYPTSAFRHLIRVFRSNGPEMCEKLAEENPQMKEVYMKHKDWLSNLNDEVNEVTFGTAVALCDDVISKLEIELERRKVELSDNDGEIWLCGEKFTAADIYWSTTLNGLYDLGLETRYWAEGKRPQVAAYFERARNHKAFLETTPNMREAATTKDVKLDVNNKSTDGGTQCCPFICVII
ncbi:ganglioside-induced differentiation-associated protein 1-like [Saccoglossus kowalevskii]|uniref:Ganglioside-induced differentiation-associated protein 1-like n=1 Tax=Saccoglossus kowalevskii TaxID=10224 RepID=A0ABM0GPW9_SACKO|nr:PREDICTED: ganglioside-induced differentiation-associated protein 1-like [Saccoglossus kowalevskii]